MERMKPAELWDRLVSVLYPPRCILCDEVVAYDDLVCDACANRERYGRISCAPGGPLVDAAAVVAYSGPARRAVWALKERGEPRALRYFAGEMAALAADAWPAITFDLAAPVPATAARLRERGFNHAGLLAAELGRLTGLPVEEGALRRREDTQVQHRLTAEQRRENARRSYALLDGGGIPDKTVLLVDDVYTTGATLLACAALLREAGAAAVYAVTAARTDDLGDRG